MPNATPTPASLETVCGLLAELRDLLHAREEPTPELMTREQVAAMLSMGTSTFDRFRAANRFGPRPVEAAGVKFLRIEVLAWTSYRTPAGELYNAGEWLPIWQEIQTRTNRGR